MVKEYKIHSSNYYLEQEKSLLVPELNLSDLVNIGQLATEIGTKRSLPIAVEVRVGDWIVYHASLTGATPENDWWIGRKARVVNLKKHSTIYERVLAEEKGIDWHQENNVMNETHAIHGGAIPLITKKNEHIGTLIISGLSQLEDHNLGIEVLANFLKNI